MNTMSASWYSSLVKNCTIVPSPFPDAEGPFSGILEFVIELGSTFTTSTSSDIAILTNQNEGLLATCAIQFHLCTTLHDVNDDDPSITYNAGIHNFIATIPLSSMVQLRNTCDAATSFSACDTAGQALTLYTQIDTRTYTADDVASAVRPGFTRYISAKGVRGVSIVHTQSEEEGKVWTTNNTRYVSQSAIMQHMPTSTNCFPGNMESCSTMHHSLTPAYTFASDEGTSESTQCYAGPFPGTQCIKMYRDSSPVRMMLFLNQVPTMSYVAGAWVEDTGDDASTTLYFTHAHTIGLQVPNNAACFPYASCGVDDEYQPVISSWVVWLMVGIAIIAACVAIWSVYRGYRLHIQASRNMDVWLSRFLDNAQSNGVAVSRANGVAVSADNAPARV